MNFNEYVNSIGFKFYKPHIGFKGIAKLFKATEKINLPLEISNTTLGEDEAGMRQKLRPLCSIPRMSSFAIGAAINRAVSSLKEGTCFVNVGVWNGFTYLSGLMGNPGKKCVGVDNFSQFGGPKKEFLNRFEKYKSPNHSFYDMDYEDYFINVHKDPIGFYIYDGEHGYKNQLRGLQIAEPFFSDNCIILVDDTNLETPREATLDFIKQSSNKYEILLDEKTAYNGHPTFWNGVIILRKC